MLEDLVLALQRRDAAAAQLQQAQQVLFLGFSGAQVLHNASVAVKRAHSACPVYSCKPTHPGLSV